MLNTSQTAQNIVKSANGSTVAINGLTKSSKLAEIGMKALAMAGNMLIAWGVSKAIELAAKAFDNYIHRVENANEATKQAIETFESVTSEVESLENKITEINQEINGLDPITDAQDNINNLKANTKQLNIQLTILRSALGFIQPR